MDHKDFIALGVSPQLQGKLQEQAITLPTEVQAQAIPAVLAGGNWMLQSPTGSGKTLAYLLPLLTRANPETKALEALILAPSRELAAQIVQVVRDYGGGLGVASLLGGANPIRQLESLKEKPKLAVGTPGRILELLKERKINGQALQTIVIDEADKMLEAGFFNEVRAILKATLKSRQVLFVSATFPAQLRKEIDSLVENIQGINCSQASTPDTISHYYFMTSQMQRTASLVKLLEAYRPSKALVFIQRNEGVGPLAGRLQELGRHVLALHSDLSQPLRKDVLAKFRAGKAELLITTDLLARGLDIQGIDTIFNYDLPLDAKHYLHRVGRTGRAGLAGRAITLVSEEKKFVIDKYAKGLGIEFKQLVLDGVGKVYVRKTSKSPVSISKNT